MGALESHSQEARGKGEARLSLLRAPALASLCYKMRCTLSDEKDLGCSSGPTTSPQQERLKSLLPCGASASACGIFALLRAGVEERGGKSP